MLEKRLKAYKLNGLLLGLGICLFSCNGNDPVPKPNAYLSLEYPQASYDKALANVPFEFEKNKLASKIKRNTLKSDTESYGVTIEYPTLKGTIFLTYKAIKNRENLINYLRDAQIFTQKHTIKADEIIEQVYENKERKAYGMFYEVGGNAASQSQFYLTDSTEHFLTGSLYFYAKPNYDSILPAVKYVEKDIKHLMETLEWHN